MSHPRIHNTSGFADDELTALALWMTQMVRVSLSRRVAVRKLPWNNNYACSGRYLVSNDSITVSLNTRAVFPSQFRNHGLRRCALLVFMDWREAFVYILAHELEHRRQHRKGNLRGRKREYVEAEADAAGHQALLAYRALGGKERALEDDDGEHHADAEAVGHPQE